MTDIQTPAASPGERAFSQLRQITIRADDEIAAVNALLAEDWRIVSIGHRPDATIYVLGQTQEKQKHRTGFLTTE